MNRSGNVLKNTLVLCVTLHVASFHEGLNSVLHLSGVRVEALLKHLGRFQHQVGKFNLPARFHHLNYDGFNRVPSVVFDLALHYSLFSLLFSLGLENGKFIFVKVTLVVHIDPKLVIRLKRITLRSLEQ